MMLLLMVMSFLVLLLLGPPSYLVLDAHDETRAHHRLQRDLVVLQHHEDLLQAAENEDPRLVAVVQRRERGLLPRLATREASAGWHKPAQKHAPSLRKGAFCVAFKNLSLSRVIVIDSSISKTPRAKR